MYSKINFGIKVTLNVCCEYMQNAILKDDSIIKVLSNFEKDLSITLLPNNIPIFNCPWCGEKFTKQTFDIKEAGRCLIMKDRSKGIYYFS